MRACTAYNTEVLKQFDPVVRSCRTPVREELNKRTRESCRRGKSYTQKKQGKITDSGKLLTHTSRQRRKRKRMLWAHSTTSQSKKATLQTPHSRAKPVLKQQSKVVQISVKICVRKAINVNLSMRSDRLHPVRISVVSGKALLEALGIEQITVQGTNIFIALCRVLAREL